MMKNQRVIVTHPGGPEVLELIEEDLPEPQAGSRVARVHEGLVGAVGALLVVQERGPERHDLLDIVGPDDDRHDALHDRRVGAQPEVASRR